MAKFEDMQGQTLVAVEGMEKGSEQVKFYTLDPSSKDKGKVYRLWHQQDCCEGVELEDVQGDVNDLLGMPLEVAEEATDLPEPESDDESYTWTFYRLATLNGWVILRWYGSSNGYYSESVDFELEGTFAITDA